MDSLTFLDRAAKAKPQPIYVLTGEEAFLKRQVVAALRKIALGTEDDSFGLSNFAGDKATFAAVHNELSTLPFLAPRRLVVIDNADPFVQQERQKLEKYVAAPAATGVLVLDVKSWPANTKLAKVVPENSTIHCKPPPAQTLPQWCADWCSARYGKQLANPAARLLDRLLDQGEDPHKLLGAFSWQLRRLVQVTRLQQQRKMSLGEALEAVKLHRGNEPQLRHFGRRIDRLYEWLVQTDQALKGGSQLPPRTVLEQFVIKLARTAPR